ncbi:MAG TPA: FtsQ-type POTRA domain-containing protein [Actinomycetes bacterium]
MAGGQTAVTHDAAARFTQGRRAGRARRVKLVGLVLVVVALTALGWWAVWRSPLLDVRRVEVVGAYHVPAAEIRATAAVPMGQPLARLNAADIADRVESIARVADVAVARRWPHTVRIIVEERTPAVAVAGTGGFVLVDGTGFAFETVGARPAGVPLVIGADAATLGADRVDAVVETLAAVPPAVRAKVTEVAAPSAETVTLKLRDGVHIVWGSAQDGARKAVVLTALMRTRATLYDVSVPEAPVTHG